MSVAFCEANYYNVSRSSYHINYEKGHRLRVHHQSNNATNLCFVDGHVSTFVGASEILSGTLPTLAMFDPRQYVINKPSDQ